MIFSELSLGDRFYLLKQGEHCPTGLNEEWIVASDEATGDIIGATCLTGWARGQHYEIPARYEVELKVFHG